MKKIKVEESIENTNINQVIIKKAMGYSVKETVDEYTLVENEYKLQKRKISVKYYPPDLNAIELILKNKDNNEFVKLTDEELEKEKQKLIKELSLLKDKTE